MAPQPDREKSDTYAGSSFAFGLAARKFLSSPQGEGGPGPLACDERRGTDRRDVGGVHSAFASHGYEDAVVATYGLAGLPCLSVVRLATEFDAASLACDRIVPGRGTVLFGCGS